MRGMTMRLMVRQVLCAACAYFILWAAGAAVNAIPAVAIELSTQRDQQPEKIVPQHAPPARVTPSIGTPQVRPSGTRAQVPASDHGATTMVSPRASGPKFVVPSGTTTNTASGASGTTVTAPNPAPPSVRTPKTVTFTPRGVNAGVVTMSRLGGLLPIGVSNVSIGGENYSVWRRGYRAHYHGRLYSCVALSALPAILIGANEFYPLAYIDAPESYCDGLSEDGCQLVWQEVDTDQGEAIPQCVAYCPWQQ
jgi:hypothetical protein